MQVFVKCSITIGTVIYTHQAGETCNKAPVREDRQSRSLSGLERSVCFGEQCWHVMVLNCELDSAGVCMHFFFH